MTTERVMPQPNVQAQLPVRNGRSAVDFYPFGHRWEIGKPPGKWPPGQCADGGMP